MEPISILGFVSAVITFLEFASKALELSKEMQNSIEGHTKTNSDLSESLIRLDGLCDEISSRHATLRNPLSKSEIAIKQIGEKCADTGEKLRSILASIAAPHGGALANLKSSAKALMKDNKIRQMRQDIQNMYQELNIHLTLAIERENSSTAKLFNDIVETQVQLQLANVDELRKCREDLQKIVKEAKQKQWASLEEMRILLKQVNKVDKKMDEAREAPLLLQSLAFPAMDDRKRQIHDAHRYTFDWIFKNEVGRGVFFKDWLTSPQPNVYWVKGKPGSGKSTLMKHLCQHKFTSELLSTWSQDKGLVIASFFFWRASSSSLEKSSEGLLRSLLYEMLRQCPSLLPTVMKSNTEYQILQGFGTQQWTVPGLTKIFEEISQLEKMTTSFCFFIDGLDEYQGEPRELANAILALASPINVKICVSSRPWPAFESAFGEDPHHTLELHQHTSSDIQLFVTEVLGNDKLYKELSSSEPAYDSVIRRIVNKAEGVFLWVALVVRELTNTLPYADSAEAMLERLNYIPSDLDEYFRYMLRNIPEFYRKDSCQIMLMLLEAEFACYPYAVYLSLDSTPSEKKSTRVLDHKLEEEAAIVRKRLQVRTQDLMEITVGQDMEIWLCNRRIQFIHRTVHDFLLNDDVYAEIKRTVGAAFNTNAALCTAYLNYLRAIPYIPTISRAQNESNALAAANRFAIYAQRLEQAGDPCDPQQYHIAQDCMVEVTRTILPGYLWDYPAKFSALSHLRKQRQRTIDSNEQQTVGSILFGDIEYFLPFALRYGLTPYVFDITKEPKPYAKEFLTKYLILQLGLFFALAVRREYDYENISGTQFIYPTHQRIHEPMVRLLLELGADPNHKVELDSAWELFLEHVISNRLPLRDQSLCIRNCKIMVAMIEHGADYTLKFRVTSATRDIFQGLPENKPDVNVMEIGKAIATYANMSSEKLFFSELQKKVSSTSVFERIKTLFWSKDLKPKVDTSI